MAITIYKGTTKKLLVQILDRQKAIIDPETILEVEAFISHVTTKEEYIKLSTTAKEGYTLMAIDGDSLKINLDKSVTAAMDVGEISITVLIHSEDTDFVGGEAVNPSQGILATVKDL
jgi:hypothetical protein